MKNKTREIEFLYKIEFEKILNNLIKSNNEDIVNSERITDDMIKLVRLKNKVIRDNALNKINKQEKINTDAKKVNTTILKEADNILNGERNTSYGSIESNFNDIATVSNILLKSKGIKLDSKDIVNIMIATKISRNGNAYKHDNILDLIGYANILSILEEDKI